MTNGMTDPEVEIAVAPLRSFIFRNRKLSDDEKIEAYGMLLDAVVDIIQFTNHKNIKEVKRVFAK